MSNLIADASGLVSLGVAADETQDPLTLCLDQYEVIIPKQVFEELEEIASYDDIHGQAASTVLDQSHDFEARSVELDANFPLDDGENAAITLANDLDAELFLCDEFNQLGLIHASLANTRLVTTPTLLSIFVQTDQLTADEARMHLDAITDARSWDENSYVQRSRSLLKKY